MQFADTFLFFFSLSVFFILFFASSFLILLRCRGAVVLLYVCYSERYATSVNIVKNIIVVRRLPALMARFDELRAAGDLLPSALVVDGEYPGARCVWPLANLTLLDYVTVTRVT